MRNGRKVETQEIVRPMFISRRLERMHSGVVRGKLVVHIEKCNGGRRRLGLGCGRRCV